MRRKETIIIAMAVLAIPCLYITLLLGTGNALAASIYHLSKAPSLTPSPAATAAPTSAPHPIVNLDPAVWAALIGLLGVIVGALIGGAFAIYQMRRNHRHEEEMERLRNEIRRASESKEQ